MNETLDLPNGLVYKEIKPEIKDSYRVMIGRSILKEAGYLEYKSVRPFLKEHSYLSIGFTLSKIYLYPREEEFKDYGLFYIMNDSKEIDAQTFIKGLKERKFELLNENEFDRFSKYYHRFTGVGIANTSQSRGKPGYENDYNIIKVMVKTDPVRTAKKLESIAFSKN